MNDPGLFEMLIIGLTISFAFIALRVLPVWPRRREGCDAYNILLNAETLRKTKRLPIRMPALFMLEDQDQWYPPGFLILCALLPQKWLQKRFWILNHLVDLGSALLIFIFSLQIGAPVYIAVAATMIYGVMPGLANEFSALNARPFGLLLFNALLLSAATSITLPIMTTPAVVLAIGLFFSHKLSVQQLWFTLPILTAATGEWVWLSLLIAIYILPFVIWPRGAWRILRGHYVIVRFWARNWRLLGAHAIRQSPVFSDGKTRVGYYADGGPASPSRFLKDVLHQNYFVAPVVTSIALGAPWIRSEFGIVLIGWIVSVYIWTFAIHFIKPLRGIGLAQQYIKFALVPSLIATGIGFIDPIDWWTTLIATAAVLATFRQYFLITINVWKNSVTASDNTEDDNLQKILESISKDTYAQVMCLPVHLCDRVAYQCRRPVYWGTHSDVFDDRLEAFFPVLQHNLHYFIQDGVNRLLLDTRYASPDELGLDPQSPSSRFGAYVLFSLSARDQTSFSKPNLE
jgi:VanZ family protein